MVLLRGGTYDAAIWHAVHDDYPTLPGALTPDDVVLDIGSHTGAFCDLAASRGATVVGYEANRENHALASINLAGRSSVTLHQAAVWRSDVDDTDLLFTPNADGENTGGGSVLFTTAGDHWQVRPAEGAPEDSADAPLSTHTVPAVALDVVLRGLGRVRFLKIDAEGAEFPILLTATRLDLVEAIGGEYHAFTDAQMDALAPPARVGRERYTVDLLRRCLEAAGFAVVVRPDHDGAWKGLFSAERL
ncbi:MAG: methyltransferase, FkbM family [Acidimicrobiales bacterium]|nr:methyltransferase, FkbM family [Acidimicrobiales bacterium]